MTFCRVFLVVLLSAAAALVLAADEGSTLSEAEDGLELQDITPTRKSFTFQPEETTEETVAEDIDTATTRQRAASGRKLTRTTPSPTNEEEDDVEDKPPETNNKPKKEPTRSRASAPGRNSTRTTPSPTNEEEDDEENNPPETNNKAKTERKVGETLDGISIKVMRGEEDGIYVSDPALPADIVFFNYTHLRAYSVDYHYQRRYIFYTAADNILRDEVVGRLTRTGLPKAVVPVGVDGPVKIAVDWLRDRLYWMTVRHQTVEVAGLDGSNRTVLFDNTRGISFPNNLAVDPYQGFLFFVSNHSIHRSSLEGHNITRLQLKRSVKCLTLDIHGKKVFFTGKTGDPHSGAPYVASANYDGQEVTTYPLSGEWNDIFSIDVFRNTLYFAHFDSDHTDSIWTADLSVRPVTAKHEYSAPEAGGIWSVRVYHPAMQKETDQQPCSSKN